MRIRISLPDDLLRLVAAATRKLRMLCSELYATAICDFLERRRASKITKRLNEVYLKEQAKLDPELHSAQLKSIEKDVW